VINGREAVEELLESNRIPSVESRGTQGINLARSVPQALGIPAREDHPGALRACAARRFQSDARAATNHNQGLPG
jgi:hypothetical protein